MIADKPVVSQTQWNRIHGISGRGALASVRLHSESVTIHRSRDSSRRKYFALARILMCSGTQIPSSTRVCSMPIYSRKLILRMAARDTIGFV